MSQAEPKRLSKLAKELNVGISTIVEFLHKKNLDIDSNPNTKIPGNIIEILEKEFSTDINVKKESEKITLRANRLKKELLSIDDSQEEDDDSEEEPVAEKEVVKSATVKVAPKPKASEIKAEQDAPEKKTELKVVGKIDLESLNKPKKQPEKKEPEKKQEKVAEPVKIKPETKAEKAEREDKEKTKVKAKAKVEELTKAEPSELEVKVIGKIDLDSLNQKTRPDRKSKAQKDAERKEKEKEKKSGAKPKKDSGKKRIKEEEIAEPEEEIVIPEVEEKPVLPPKKEEEEIYKSTVERLSGPTVVGRIELPVKEDKKHHSHAGDSADLRAKKKKRKRIKKGKERIDVADKGFVKPPTTSTFAKPKEWPVKDFKGKKGKKKAKPEISGEEVDSQIKETLSRLSPKGKSKTSKYRREKRDAVSQKLQVEFDKKEEEKKIIKVTEFLSVNEISTLMSVPVNEIIATCMNLGLFVSINQRIDAETISVIAEEFGYKVEFTTADVQDAIKDEIDAKEDLEPRPPIVTVMGHVDHGKTKLLDYIRSTNVVAGEAGGITQHIGAYNVTLENGRKITFLDTPGHEAFTAMRARGAQVTDMAIIVIAADDGVMPQTREAINHAQAAGVPLIFAINKIDKEGANPERIMEELAKMNFLVEAWGGKYQSQEIAAKQGLNVDHLLEKILLEAEMLELKANPNKRALGTIIESALDKGRGFVATILVKAGTLRPGDMVLAGSYYGRVKAMYNERNQRVTEAGPSTPVLILGLNGAPQAGDKFNVMANEHEAKEIATRREQLQREQGIRTQKHITLDEIGRRLAIGNFKELNVIVKGDVDGSIEALSDSLIKLSTEEIQVNLIHKAVGQISESDVMLAAASNAIIIGFQVRPSVSARKLAEKEEIDIRLYSIIYDAIEELKAALEGMLSPEIKEEILGSLEVRETFKITKVGTIAGCMVIDGKASRSAKIRIIRDGIVVHTGELSSLKRFKDEVKEVINGLECGLNIHNFNDIKVGDVIECFEETEVRKKL